MNTDDASNIIAITIGLALFILDRCCTQNIRSLDVLYLLDKE